MQPSAPTTSFFSVGGRAITFNGAALQVFEYAPPHYFKDDRMITLYIVDHASVLAILTRLVGPQFAGGVPQHASGARAITPAAAGIGRAREAAAAEHPRSRD